MRPDSEFYPRCLQVLEKSPLFGGLPKQSLDRMMQEFAWKTWPGRLHLPAEQHELYFHIIISGRIEVSRNHPDTGRSVTMWLLGPGDGFDIITLLDGKYHDAIFVTLDNVETLVAPVDTVRQWLLNHPDFNRSFLPYLGRQMRYLENLSTDLVLHDTITRLARLILHYVDRDHLFDNQSHYPVALINDLSHDALARMIGSVRSVVNRHMQQLKKDGAVQFHRGFIAVKDLEMLVLHAGKALAELKKRHTRGG